MKPLGMSACAKSAKALLSTTFLTGTAMAMVITPAYAQDQNPESQTNRDSDAPAATEEGGEPVILVTGIRSSLQSALNERRNADSLIEVIQAEDIGKLPDQNLAEVLENITGIQITRTAGVGTGVQIRGTNDNRTEINGITTLGSGTGRGGINFEDVNASIIDAVEVIKAPQASTIEGSVGGTINLRTIRPLDLSERLTTIRVQGEYSELSDSFLPRISGSFGQRWDTGIGEIGIVLSGSYTEQEATSFRPRVDRDNLIAANTARTAGNNAFADAPIGDTTPGSTPIVPDGPDFDFLGIQFLNQELENFEFETINFAGTLEWAPSDNVKFYFDAIINDQERRQDSSRVQGSGVSAVDLTNVPDTFETITFGSLDGVNLGTIQAALTGTVQPNLDLAGGAADPEFDDDDPNLRFSSDTGARISESQIYRFGTEFDVGRFSARIEASRSTNNTTNPNLSTTVNFINPNPLTPLDGTSNDNAVPFIFDLTGGSLTFGIDFDSPFAPTVADLLDPANIVLDAVQVGNDSTSNSENAFRIDTSLDVEDLTPFFTSFDVGYRYSDTQSEFNDVGSGFGTGSIAASPSGLLFADLLVPGPDNFDEADGRTLAFRNFILIDPDRAFSDPEGTLDILQAALATTTGNLNDPSLNAAGSFVIEEETHAFYAQANFELGRLRGNFGLRYIDTSLDSIGNTVAFGVVEQVITSGGYTELLPRLNLVFEPIDDVVIRASWGEDINRPDFGDLDTSISFGTSPNAPVEIGNPSLAPETVTSFDASIDWFFAPSSVVSIGFFHKRRSNLFVTQLEEPFEDPVTGFRDITDPCEGGGIFNPAADQNVFVPGVPENGICVPIETQINDTAVTTQTGIEFAVQYDLSQFEDTLGFASGFGIIANYTYQDFGGGEATNGASGRGADIFEASTGTAGPFAATQGLLDFSENAFNITGYYEKYGLSARARYTWRSSFRTLDTAGGASLNSTLGFPVVTESRGQLNASIVYDITDNINIGVEGVNLTKSNITQSCVNSGALVCFQGLPDRRVTVGGTVRF